MGIDSCPEIIGSGFAEDGREMLSFLPGEGPHLGPWTGDAVATIGQMLRRFHDAGQSHLPPLNATWKQSLAGQLQGEHSTYGHGDLGP